MYYLRRNKENNYELLSALTCNLNWSHKDVIDLGCNIGVILKDTSPMNLPNTQTIVKINADNSISGFYKDEVLNEIFQKNIENRYSKYGFILLQPIGNEKLQIEVFRPTENINQVIKNRFKDNFTAEWLNLDNVVMVYGLEKNKCENLAAKHMSKYKTDIYGSVIIAKFVYDRYTPLNLDDLIALEKVVGVVF